MIIFTFPLRVSIFALLHCAFLGSFFTAVGDDGNDRYRTWFEWGDYDMLIDSLAPWLTGESDSLPPQTTARYHLYCAMAFFRIGKIGGAQHHYFYAMNRDSTATLDQRYLSEPMIRFCDEQRELFYRQQRQLAVQDSLEFARSQAFEQNVRSIKKQASHSARTTDAAIGITLLASGAGAAAASLCEYYSYKDAYRDFRDHAASGRKQEYESLLPVLNRANRNIFIGGLGTALTVSGGIVFSIRAAAGHRGEHDKK